MQLHTVFPTGDLGMKKMELFTWLGQNTELRNLEQPSFVEIHTPLPTVPLALLPLVLEPRK